MPAMQSPNAIFFDLDGTLIDNTRGFDSLIADVFSKFFPQTVVDSKIEPRVFNAFRKNAGLLWENMFVCRAEGKDVLSEIFYQTLLSRKLDESQSSAMEIIKTFALPIFLFSRAPFITSSRTTGLFLLAMITCLPLIAACMSFDNCVLA